MSQVTFKVRFFKGEGGLFFFGEGVPPHFRISSDDSKHEFTVEQSPGSKEITVTGDAPFGGTLEIQVTGQNGQVLSAFSQNSFTEGPFMGLISYEV